MQGKAFKVCPVQVASTVHRLEQAKYWSNLKEKHNSHSLAAKQRSAIEEHMVDCMRSADAAPAAELLAMVQAGCEEEVCMQCTPPRLQSQRCCSVQPLPAFLLIVLREEEFPAKFYVIHLQASAMQLS